jgi:hypothetical protein
MSKEGYDRRPKCSFLGTQGTTGCMTRKRSYPQCVHTAGTSSVESLVSFFKHKMRNSNIHRPWETPPRNQRSFGERFFLQVRFFAPTGTQICSSRDWRRLLHSSIKQYFRFSRTVSEKERRDIRIYIPNNQ